MKAVKTSLAVHTTLAEMVKERTDEREFLETLQVKYDQIYY